MHCYEVTLNVWSGNTSAEKFYEKMGMKTKERQMEYILDNYEKAFKRFRIAFCCGNND